jgi:transposase InsO family protein
MRRSFSEKREIIRIVEQSELSVNRTLAELGIKRSTFYGWYKRYLEEGEDGLKERKPARRSFWNQIPDEHRQQVVEVALERPELSCRELAFHITDTKRWFISESSVYRILKAQNLVTSPALLVNEAADEFRDKTTRIHQQWQMDFTYLRVIDWGWYFLGTVLDDYSRYIVAWELSKEMKAVDSEKVVDKALMVTGLLKENRPRLLSDNGPCFKSGEFKHYLQGEGMYQVFGAPYHPQTQGKIERYHRTMKNVIKLENYYTPDQLRQSIQAFVDYYNNRRYHESLDNLTPADVYHGRAERILKMRKETKRRTIKMRRKKYFKRKIETYISNGN